MKILRLICLLAFLIPIQAWSLSLGQIELKSTLHQRFDARIQVTGIETGQENEIKVDLASQQDFDRAGIARPFLLMDLKFKLVSSGDGTGYIHITSRDYVREPYLNFILRVDSPQAHVLREYAVLLDL